MLVAPPLAAPSRAAPIAAAGPAARAWLTAARAWILAWCGIHAGAYLLDQLLVGDGPSALTAQYITTPLEAAAVLWALSLWQRAPLARLTLRLAIPLFVIAFGVLAAIGDARGASSLAGRVYAMLAFGAAVYTLGTRGNGEAESRWQSDWFWMSGGLALYFGAAAALAPLGGVPGPDHPELVIRASVVKSLVNVVAFAALTVGALCPQSRPQPQASLSQVPSA